MPSRVTSVKALVTQSDVMMTSVCVKLGVRLVSRHRDHRVRIADWLPDRCAVGAVEVSEAGMDQEVAQVLVVDPEDHPADVHFGRVPPGREQLLRGELVTAALGADQLRVKRLGIDRVAYAGRYP